MIDERTAEDLAVHERIDRYLRETSATADLRVVPLTGDASDRRYFRVIGHDARSTVLAVHASPIEAAALPFVNVAQLLESMPLPVPAILGHSDALGILELEDLGDVTLQAHLGAVSADEHAAAYREAVRLIEVLQRRGAELRHERWLPYRLAFDVEKLTWEMNFFVRHFLGAYRGVALSDQERAALEQEWSAIVTELSSEPRVLCHRDYHSRNLMQHAGRLYVIDFQDARMGPDTYDLVSLLRDSYIDIPDGQVDDLIEHFLSMRQAPDDGFRRRFDVMAVQRNIKALGTFGYQTTTRNNPVYIQYIPRTLRYVRENLRKYSRFSRLLDLLARHIDELR
jgi:aminoglycoside/choline kinase family phosphotransferase